MTKDNGYLNWRDPEDENDRALPYRNMRRTLRKDTPFTADVDQVEYVIDKATGECIPLAVVELTLRKWEPGLPPEPPQKYLDRILERYYSQSSHAILSGMVAKALNVPLYLVVYNEDASTFWCHELSHIYWGEEWRRMNRTQYETFLLAMRHRYTKTSLPSLLPNVNGAAQT